MQRDATKAWRKRCAPLRRLLEAGIPVFLLTGNHDMPNSVGRATSLDIFGSLPLANLHVARKPGIHLVQTRSGPLQIVAAPWMMRSALAYSPLQNLRTYLQRQGVPAERAALLLKYARRLVGDEEGATDALAPDEPASTPLPFPSASPEEPEASLVL